MLDASEVPVAVKIRLVTSEESADMARRTFRSLVGQVRGEHGCVACHLLEDVHEPGMLTFLATWRSQKDLQRFIRTAGFQRLLAGIELAAEEPEVEIRTDAGARGMDYFREFLETRSS